MVDLDKPHYLAMYKFKIRRRFKQDEWFDFDGIPYKNNKHRHYDIIDIINKIFTKEEFWDIHRKHKEEDENKLLQTNYKGLQLKEYNILEKERIVEGIINYGLYGNEKDMIEMTNREIYDSIDKNTLVAEPYYFFLQIPKKQKEGCLILEYKNGTGIKDNFSLGLSRKFASFDDLFIDISRNEPVESQVIYDKGIVSSIIVNVHDSPQNITSNEKIVSKQVKYELVLDKKSNPRLLEKYIGQIKENIINIFPTYGNSKKDSIKAKTKHDNRKLNVDLEENIGFLLPLIEITNELKFKDFDEGNNLKKESLRKLALKYSENNFKEIWGNDFFIKE